MYIANHINSFSTSSPNGVEVYCQVNPNFTAKSRAVAQNAVANLSTMFNSRGVKTRAQDDGRDWYCVLRETDMPAVLVEHCFISNSADLAKLNDPSHIVTMAKAVVKAVCDAMPNPVGTYDDAKLTAGIKILQSMGVLPLLGNFHIVLDQEYYIQPLPNLKIDYTIRSTSSLGVGGPTGTYNIKDGKFTVDVSNEIQLFGNKIKNKADTIFDSPFPPLFPDFPSSYNPMFIGSDLSIGLDNKLNSAAFVIGNGSFSYSVDAIALMLGTLKVTTGFNSQINDNPYDINSFYSVEITFTYTNFNNPFPQPNFQLTPEMVTYIALGCVAAVGLGVIIAVGAPAAGAAAASGTLFNFLYQFLNMNFAPA